MRHRTKYQAVSRVAEVSRILGPLAGQCVFVGGAATGLLLTDPAIADIRPTLDIDVIVELATRTELYRLQEGLRRRDSSKMPTRTSSAAGGMIPSSLT